MAKKKTKKVNQEPNPVGAPTKYAAAFAKQAYKLCLLGTTDEQLADFFNVSVATINVWKHKHPKFVESIRKGKILADAEVANSLYERAKGYSHKEDKIFCNNGQITSEETIKHYPPDTAAAFIWLKNRAGWRDKQDVEHSGGINVIIDK